MTEAEVNKKTKVRYIRVEFDDSNPENKKGRIVRFVSYTPPADLDFESKILIHVSTKVSSLVGREKYGGNMASFSNVSAHFVKDDHLDSMVIPGLAKDGQPPPTVREVCEQNRILD